MLGYCTAFGKDPILDLPVRIGVFPPAVEDDFEIRSIPPSLQALQTIGSWSELYIVRKFDIGPINVRPEASKGSVQFISRLCRHQTIKLETSES
jgi:hypothetical protein